MEQNKVSVETVVGSGILAVLLLVVFFGSYEVIQPGTAGVVFNSLTGSLRTVGQGLTLKLPFVTTIRSYPVSLRTYSMVKRSSEGSSKEDDSIDLPTLEGQHIRQDISVTYNTSEEHASDVFKAFKGSDIGDIENTFIRRTVITVMQNAAGRLSLTQLISSQREKLQEEIQTALGTELKKMGFFLDKVNLGASHLPESIEQQMQQKMAAQQQAQQADYALQKATTMAKAVVAEANGQAESELIHAQAAAKAQALMRQTLTPEIIKLRAVERWNGELPKFIFGGGSIPMLDMKGLMNSTAPKGE